VLLNAVAPNFLVTFVLMAVLSVMALRTLRTARKLHELEKAALSASPEPSAWTLDAAAVGPGAAPRRAPWHRSTKAAASWAQLLQLLTLWAAFAGLQLGKSWYERCTWQYGVLYGCQLALVLACTMLFARLAMAQADAAEGSENEEPLLQPAQQAQHGVTWTGHSFAAAAGWAAGAGALAGFIGLGG
jgi:hypothetical protein